MGWPKGVPRKIKPQPDGSVEIQTDKTVDQVAQGVTVASRKRVTLADPRFDPFNQWKTDEKHFHYRALNTNPKNMQVKKAEGWEIVDPQATYGDLILAKIPREEQQERVKETRERTKAQITAAVDQFKETAAGAGVQVDQD